MSSHRRRTSYFSRATKPRLALIRGLMLSLVEHGRITTTVQRAKEVRRHIEKAVTLGKKGDTASTRLLMSRLPHKEAVSSIVKDISVRMKTRPGGYTRVIKIGRRPGDTAEMAFLEFVDFDYTADKNAIVGDDKKGTAKTAQKKAQNKAKKAATAATAAKRKSVMRIQKTSRAESRA